MVKTPNYVYHGTNVGISLVQKLHIKYMHYFYYANNNYYVLYYFCDINLSWTEIPRFLLIKPTRATVLFMQLFTISMNSKFFQYA